MGRARQRLLRGHLHHHHRVSASRAWSEPFPHVSLFQARSRYGDRIAKELCATLGFNWSSFLPLTYLNRWFALRAPRHHLRYGDLTPSTARDRYFTMAFVGVGLAFVYESIAGALDEFFEGLG